MGISGLEIIRNRLRWFRINHFWSALILQK
jgi:hypothetical protein